MKKIIPALLLLIMAVCAQAQQKFDPEKFRADMKKYITTEAHLTQSEASKFFPLYDEMKNKQRTIHQQIKNLNKQKPTTEAACKAAIQKRDNLEQQMCNTERAYHEKFLKVVSASKLYDILQAEAKFKKQAFMNAAKKGNHDHNKK